jgi:hypothetical protein
MQTTSSRVENSTPTQPELLPMPYIIFADKASCPLDPPRLLPCYKHQSRLKVFATVKRASLLVQSIDYEAEKIYKIELEKIEK